MPESEDAGLNTAWPRQSTQRPPPPQNVARRDGERPPLVPPMPTDPTIARETAIARTRDRAKAAADRHSRFVRFAKFSLPVIGLIIAVVVVGRYWLYTHLPGINMPAVLFSKNGLTMVEPRLTGRSRDRAYDIGANRATQAFDSPKVVQLEQLAGRIEMKDNAWAKIESRNGTYDGNNDTLKLVGGVKATTSTGYLLLGEDADIDLSKGNMSTDKPVHIQGPTGQLDAGGARVTDGGATIQFTGRVHMTITPAVLPAPAGADPSSGTGTTQ